jgi:hypothetical protein
MKPAFDSLGQAVGFCLLVLVLLLLPAVFTKGMLPPREEIYSSVPWKIGPYPYIHHAIFEEKGDVDVAFMGGSLMYMGIDTPYVEDALTKSLGRKATAITTAWNWMGFDALYFVAQDLLVNRKVNTIVLIDVTSTDKKPHAAAPYWFRFGDNAEALRGMPLKFIPQYYFAAILGMPRNLLSLIRPNDPRFFYSAERGNPNFSEIPHPSLSASNPADRLGSQKVEVDYHFAKFVPYTPNPSASPADACVYSPATADKFQFSNETLPPLELHFAQKFGALARAHGVHLVMLTIPEPGEPETPYITERVNWPAIMNTDVTMVGIPPAKFYAGMTPDDIDKFSPDRGHLNENGQQYFTRLITPALVKIYEAQPSH